MLKGLERCIAALFAGWMLLVLLVVLLCFEGTSFSCKRAFLLPQWAMLLCGAAALCALGLLLGRRAERMPKRPLLAPAMAWLALLGVQLVLCFHAYFITGWDVRAVTESAYAIAGGQTDIHSGYLSMYPNNIPLVLCFAAILRVLRLILGNPGLDRCIFVLIAVQCALNTATGMLLHRIAVHETQSRRFGWYAAVIYMVFVGLSPWLMIPYSDSMALFFPTAVIAVAQAYREERLGWAAWPLMGLLAAMGFLIKPQAVIAAIAVALVEAVRAMTRGGWMKSAKRVGCMALAFALLAGPVRQAAVDASPIDVKPEKNIGMLHFVMMGLGEKRNGIYDGDDVELSCSAAPEERRAVQMREIIRRLSGMSWGGLPEHLKKKTLTNYADGTFAWGCEGEFFSRWIEDKDSVISPLLKSLIDTGSARFPILLTVLQSIWLALLLGCVLCGVQLFGGEREGGTMDVMMLSIIGLTLFEWIFEARARYLYLYAPVYVLLGAYGWWRAAARIRNPQLF